MPNYLDNYDVIDANGDITNVLLQDRGTLALANQLNSRLTAAENNIDLINEIVVNVKDFGAVGDGVTDDYDAIMSALNSLPDSGGTIYFPAGNYAISHGIDIGDGEAATVVNGNKSSKQNIKLIGAGCKRASTPLITQITPLNDVSYIFNVRGLINNVEIDGFNLFSNGRATYGLFICATNCSTFRNIEIYNPKYCGLQILGGYLPVGNYNTACYFENIQVSLATDTTIGLQLLGDISANNDTWLTTFVNCRFQSMGNTDNCTSAIFRFCDNITFIRCHFVTYSQTGRGIDLNALDTIPNNPFPTGLSFIDCSIANVSITEDAANGKLIGVNRFYGYGITDGEVLPPRDNRLIGFDSQGNFFGGFGCEELDTIQDVIKVMNTLPNQKSIPIVCSSNLTNTLFNVTTTSSGLLTRINDNVASLSINNNVGFYSCRIDTAGNVTESRAMTWPNI